MIIQGMGVVSAHGRGIGTFAEAVERGFSPTTLRTLNRDAGEMHVFQIPDAAFMQEPKLSRGLRRADRLSKVSTLAALDAVADAGVDCAPERLGVVLGTALGPHDTTFGFLDGILEYGDAGASPTEFSHSVHNAAVSYVSGATGARGPTLTLTQFDFPFQHAAQVAQQWLDDDVCDVVLLGAADVLGDIMLDLAHERMPCSADGVPQPQFAEAPAYVPGEGAVLFVVSRDASDGAYADMRAAPRASDAWTAAARYLRDPECCAEGAIAPPQADCYLSVFGNTVIGSAFHAASAAWSVRAGAASPVACVCERDGMPMEVTLRRVEEGER